jgi:hypothetical protein
LEKPQHKNDDVAEYILIAVNVVALESDLQKLGVPKQVPSRVIFLGRRG